MSNILEIRALRILAQPSRGFHTEHCAALEAACRSNLFFSAERAEKEERRDSTVDFLSPGDGREGIELKRPGLRLMICARWLVALLLLANVLVTDAAPPDGLSGRSGSEDGNSEESARFHIRNVRVPFLSNLMRPLSAARASNSRVRCFLRMARLPTTGCARFARRLCTLPLDRGGCGGCGGCCFGSAGLLATERRPSLKASFLLLGLKGPSERADPGTRGKSPI